MTALRAGAKVHAGDRTENGGYLGSSCRYRGSYVTTLNKRVYVKLDDGSIKAYGPAAVHHEQDCPGKKTP